MRGPIATCIEGPGDGPDRIGRQRQKVQEVLFNQLAATMKSTRPPLITALSYSAGVQSHWLLWMVLLGLIDRPKNFIVLNADPGNENESSYRHTEEMRERCRESGIPFITAEGPNLYLDLLGLKNSGKTRFDQPPFWTETDHGKEGKLQQRCTRAYKTVPMDQALRAYLWKRFGIPENSGAWLGENSVERWIGFTADEDDRVRKAVKNENRLYQCLRFPLHERGMTKSDVVAEYRKHGKELPERSLCNHCPFYGLRDLKNMHDNRPKDWEKSVKVDESCRDLSSIGVTNKCYLNRSLVPLRELAAMNFELVDPVENDLAQCNSGVCFT